jgi:hypothetical protein
MIVYHINLHQVPRIQLILAQVILRVKFKLVQIMSSNNKRITLRPHRQFKHSKIQKLHHNLNSIQNFTNLNQQIKLIQRKNQ